MGLEQLELETGFNKVEVATTILQVYEPPEGYYFADSGGKDSSVTRDILIKSGVKFDAHYCISPIDPPQIRQFLKENHPDTQWDIHAKGFWNLVVTNNLPTRKQRWCCEFIKEAGGEGRTKVVGNRREEGGIRRSQCFVDHQEETTVIRPILNFDNYDVWQYIRENNVPYCSLYDEGATRKAYGKGVFERLGCVLCPFSRNIARDEEYFPKIVRLWKLACNRIIEYNHAKGTWLNFKTGEELYQWWVKRK